MKKLTPAAAAAIYANIYGATYAAEIASLVKEGANELNERTAGAADRWARAIADQWLEHVCEQAEEDGE